MAASDQVKEIACLYSANGTLPVYEICYAGKRIAFYLSRAGAPACIAGLEEIIAFGAKKLVVFGSCGILDQTAAKDKIIIPVSAVRDEGTSYHYLPASVEIFSDSQSVAVLKQSLKSCGLPYVTGKTWMTDAIYRENSDTINARKSFGSLCVEMECPAVFAVTQFRQIKAIQFLYSAGNLDSEEWEPWDLTEYGIAECSRYVALALECAVNM